MRSRPAILVLAWIGVTLGVTLLAWLAVQVVGDQVGGSDSTVLTEAQVTGLLQDAPSASPTPTASSPSASPRPSTSPGPRPTPSASRTASSSPQPTHSTNPGSSASTKSFSTTGGVVAATCRGSVISLESARPADGWTVEVKDRGPERVEVRFENDAGDRTEVRVSCVHGDPVRDASGGPG
jgi:hypothetical protein